MRLVYTATREPVAIDDTVTTSKGDKVVVKGFIKPRHSGSTGRVLVVYEGFTEPAEYYPSVIGAEWIDREDRPADA
ncbi:hypothetical protein [Cupriavidus sp. TMH.W2]|uniref:hypothetical protein n=1 Tax=Cupriavidus sp. TMH.W2 TaxID=3434465 RepID=UPI003D784473